DKAVSLDVLLRDAGWPHRLAPRDNQRRSAATQRGLWPIDPVGRRLLRRRHFARAALLGAVVGRVAVGFWTGRRERDDHQPAISVARVREPVDVSPDGGTEGDILRGACTRPRNQSFTGRSPGLA